MPLHQHQKNIASDRSRFKIIRGGRRGGKTLLETEVMAFKAVQKKGRRVYYIAPTQKQAREIIWELLKKRLAGKARISEQRLELMLPNNSIIQVAGWENRENFRGKPAHHITFDEVDTMKDFFIGWQEIFRPSLIDTNGSADFIGTPKKENPNLRRLEKEAEGKNDWKAFHFTSWDNPVLPRIELKKYEAQSDATTYRQEILAEYVENEGALFKYTALIDLFTNSLPKKPDRFMTVDVADDGTDKTIFTLWQGLEAYNIQQYTQMQTDGIVSMIRELAAKDSIPYSNITVDAIGVGAGVASSPLLKGVMGYKSSYSAMRTELDPVRLPNVHFRLNAPLTTEYKNLRSQCIFELARRVNDHTIAVRIDDQRIKSAIIEELSSYQDVSQGDGKRMATQKEDVKEQIGRSPDLSDTLIMRMYFELRDTLSPQQDSTKGVIHDKIMQQFRKNEERLLHQSTR